MGWGCDGDVDDTPPIGDKGLFGICVRIECFLSAFTVQCSRQPSPAIVAHGTVASSVAPQAFAVFVASKNRSLANKVLLLYSFLEVYLSVSVRILAPLGGQPRGFSNYSMVDCDTPGAGNQPEGTPCCFCN